MEYEFLRIDQLSLSEVERTAGPTALLVRRGLESARALSSTFILGRKSFRLAVERLPSGHRPLDLLAQELEGGRRERAARAYERVRQSLDLVPPLGLPSARCLVWASPVWRPRKRTVLGPLAVIEARSEELASAVAELWASLFLETVLERAPSGLRRLEVAVGVTEDNPEARAALLVALASTSTVAEATLPAPGQGAWSSPALAFDRSLERLRASARRPVLRRAFGTPPLSLALGRWGPGLDREQVQALLARQSGRIGGAVARDLVGPVEPLAEVDRGGERIMALAQLGGQLALHVAQMGELGQGVERLGEQARSRHDWMAEVDLALLPDDGLRTTVEEQLGLVSAATELALRACLAAARLTRTYAALSGRGAFELDLGVRYPLLDLLADFERAAERLSARVQLGTSRDEAKAGGALPEGLLPASAVDCEVHELAERHPEIFPRFDAGARSTLRRAFELARQHGSGGILLERRVEIARVRGDQAAADVESRLPRLIAARVSPLRSLVQGACLLRERARKLEVLADAMLRVVALEVDRRLSRLEPGLPEGAVWHCHVAEILDTVDLRGTSLLARVNARRSGEAAHYAAANLASPRALQRAGQLEPVSLAQVRALDQAVWLLLAPERVSYAGRPLDTLPCMARSLGVPWPRVEAAG